MSRCTGGGNLRKWRPSLQRAPQVAQPARIRRWRFEQLRAQQVYRRVEHCVVGGQAFGVALGETSDGRKGVGLRGTGGERPAVGQRQEVLQGPLEYLEAVFASAGRGSPWG